MEEPVNLNKVRKARARAQAKRDADRNAAYFGLTKSQKDAARKNTERARQRLQDGRLTDERCTTGHNEDDET